MWLPNMFMHTILMKRNATHCNNPRNEKSEEQMRAEGRQVLRAKQNYEPLRETTQSDSQQSLEEVMRQ